MDHIGRIKGITSREQMGAAVRELRRAAGLTQQQLAERAAVSRLCVSDYDIADWMDGLLPNRLDVRERWMREYAARSTLAIDMLATPMGWDCAGAVQFCPAEAATEMLARRPGLVGCACPKPVPGTNCRRRTCGSSATPTSGSGPSWTASCGGLGGLLDEAVEAG